MRTMREPTTFSSAAAVTSAILCCTSIRIGFRRMLKRIVTSRRKGMNASEMSASFQSRKKRMTEMATIMTMLVAKNTRP
jgi:hypothetical protein